MNFLDIQLKPVVSEVSLIAKGNCKIFKSGDKMVWTKFVVFGEPV